MMYFTREKDFDECQSHTENHFKKNSENSGYKCHHGQILNIFPSLIDKYCIGSFTMKQTIIESIMCIPFQVCILYSQRKTGKIHKFYFASINSSFLLSRKTFFFYKISLGEEVCYSLNIYSSLYGRMFQRGIPVGCRGKGCTAEHTVPFSTSSGTQPKRLF